MDTTPPPPSSPDLQWSNVGFGFAFIVMNMVLSQLLSLQIGTSIVVSAVRCVVQLTFVATILQHVFAARNLWTVAAIARTSHSFASQSLIYSGGIPVLLNMLGAFETGGCAFIAVSRRKPNFDVM